MPKPSFKRKAGKIEETTATSDPKIYDTDELAAKRLIDLQKDIDYSTQQAAEYTAHAAEIQEARDELEALLA